MARTPLSILAVSLLTTLGLSAAAFAQCPLTFAPFSTCNVGVQPNCVATADLNGDGKLDLVVANYGAASISVCMGNGNGTFAPAATYGVGASPLYVAVADLNGDGKPDIVASNSNSNTISVFINNGNSTFAATGTYATGSLPKQVAVGDLNGDGRPDLAVANALGGTVSVLLNNGTGGFGPKTDFPTGTNTVGAAIADFNGDGIPDLAVSRGGAGGSGGVAILRGNGNGTFQAAVNTGAGGGNWINLADLNADGFQDLIVLNQASNSAYIQFGNGNGTFRPVVTIASANVGSAQGVGIGDINGDGELDLILPMANANAVQVYTGIHGGTFNVPITLATAASPVHAVLGDFNGDGAPDLAIPAFNAVQTSVILSTTPILNFTAQPRSWSMILNGNITMGVTANGTAWQWYHNGVALNDDGHVVGSHTPIMSVLGTVMGDSGFYYCLASRGCASKASEQALVAIYNPCAADFNADGTIDFFDYLDFVDAFSIGC